MTTVSKEVSRALLPIIKPKELKSNPYMLRLSPLGVYEKKEIFVFLKEIDAQWVMSTESSSKDKLHYHIVLATELEEEEMREHIRVFLSRHFPNPKRGDANKQYNLKCIEDFDVSIQYILKDGVYEYCEEICPSYIQAKYDLSFKKYDKVTFAKRLEQLKQDFKIGEIVSVKEFMIEFVKLKSEYRQPINMTYIHQTAVSCDINRNPRRSRNYVESYLDKIERFS